MRNKKYASRALRLVHAFTYALLCYTIFCYLVYAAPMLLVQVFLQIIFESIPVSSSGHLMLWQRLMGSAAAPLSSTCHYVLHGPTLLLLVCYFRAAWVPLLLHCWRYRCIIVRMTAFCALTDTVSAILYTLAHHYGASFPLWAGFLVTMLALFSLHSVERGHVVRRQATLRELLIIGVVQGIAGLPGVSRLATTYVAGRWLGLSAYKSFSVSCMVQWPLIAGGFMYGVWKEYGSQHCVDLLQGWMLLGLLGATVVAYVLLWVVQGCMERNTLWRLSYYMLIPFVIALFL